MYFKRPARLCTAAALVLSLGALATVSAQTVPVPARPVTVGVEVALAANATPAMGQTRGALLYTTHCVSCHTTEMHWRDKRSASNWPALKAQVRRWQDAASLSWGDADILDVSRYLNETIYRFELTADAVSLSGPGTREPVVTVTRIALQQRP